MILLLNLLLFFAVFYALFYNRLQRQQVMLLGAAALLLVGLLSGHYTLLMALESIYFETLLLIFGMSVVSSLLAESGWFDHLARELSRRGVNQGRSLWVLFVLITYLLSLSINNLAAMLVLLPITLKIYRQLQLNPVPVLVAEVVASNLGGASTMVGDFPNMIIASAGDLHFLDFIGGMMVPALLLLAATLLYFQWQLQREPLQSAAERVEFGTVVVDQRLFALGRGLLLLSLSGFLLADWLEIRPGWIALVVGSAGLYWGRWAEERIWSVAGVSDVLFFAALFVMVGALTASGLSELLARLLALFGDTHLAQLIGLMWVAAVVTLFLNAGPATAFFVPLAAQIYLVTPDMAVWWALSLGVLAGSSGALTGATAGAVAESHFRRHRQHYPLPPHQEGAVLDFRTYLQWGLPLMLLFLTLSSLYLMAVARW
jgi:Na+/H+ antiporter NhaD/arsenite permease-like protein